MTKTVTPFGLWPSPLPAESVAGQAVRFSRVEVSGGALYWSELRPYEKGRTGVMRQRPGEAAQDLLPPPFSARSRVHEYGGGEFTVVGGEVYFVNEADQEVWRLDGGQPELRRQRARHAVRRLHFRQQAQPPDCGGGISRPGRSGGQTRQHAAADRS